MTKNNSFRLNPEVNRTMRNFLAHAEGTTGETGKTSIVRNGESGLSVGRVQMDMSKHKYLADEFVAIGKAKAVPGADNTARTTSTSSKPIYAARIRAARRCNSHKS